MHIKNPAAVYQLAFDDNWPTSVAFLGSSRRIAAGNRNGDILIWHLPENPPNNKDDGKNKGSSKKDDAPPDVPPVRMLVGHTNGITHLRATPDGHTLISSSLDHSVRLWNPDAAPTGTGDIILDRSKRERRARRKSDAERKKILEAPGTQVETVSEQHVLQGHDNWVKALGISRDGKRLISGDDDCLSIVWNLADRKPIAQWHGYDRVWVRSSALSPDGKIAFTAEYAGNRSSFDRPAAQARLWNAETGKLRLDLLKVWTPKIKDEDRIDSYGYARAWGKLMKRGLVAADFSPDGKLLALGQGGETNTGKVHLVEVTSGKILRTVSGHRYGVCDVKFSADGKYVLSSGRDTTVRICRTDDGKEVAELGKSRGGQFKDWLNALSVSPDEQYVAAADIAGIVHVWKLAG